MPKEEKFCFYTYDKKTGTIGKYNEEKGHAGLQKKDGLITFFWAEEVKL